MKKTPKVKIPAQASHFAATKADIETLKAAANVNQPVKEEVIQEPVVEEPVIEEKPPVEIVVEEPIIQEPVVEDKPAPVVEEPKIEEQGGGSVEELSIFKDVLKPTQEDKHITDTTTTALSTLAEQAREEIDLSDEKKAKKQSDQVRAGIFVEVMDVIFMLLCLFITWDFSHENQKRFTLNPERKKAIQFNLFKIYQLDNKKREPKKDVWLLILGSYAPMLVIAIISLINRLRKRQEAKREAMAQVVIHQPANNNDVLNQTFQQHVQQPVQQPVVQPPVNGTGLEALDKKTKRPGVKPGQKRGPYKKKK